MTKNNLTKHLSYSSVIILLVLIPLFIKDKYHLHILIMIGVNIVLASGLRLIMTTGQVSFAHAGFMAIGAYTCALLVMKLGLSFWFAWLLGGVMAIIVAVIIGYPTLRLKGAYFFLASFAFGQLVILIFNRIREPFGGPTGIMSIPYPDAIVIPHLVTLEIGSPKSFYYFILAFTLATILIIYRLDKSRIGMIFSAIREGDVLSECVGINIMKYKILAFTIGCFFAGLSGGLYAHYIRYVGPAVFGMDLMIFILLYVIAGGSSNVWGPILGASIFTILPEVTRIASYHEPMLFGGILVTTMLFLPEGIISLLPQVSTSLRTAVGKKAT